MMPCFYFDIFEQTGIAQKSAHILQRGLSQHERPRMPLQPEHNLMHRKLCATRSRSAHRLIGCLNLGGVPDRKISIPSKGSAQVPTHVERIV
jgi:hypothetical protein